MNAIALIAAGACAAGPAGGPDFEIAWWTIDAGAGASAGGAFEVAATVGQHDAAGAMTGGSFELVGGFWPGLMPVDCEADFNGDGSLDILDFVAFQGAFTDGDPSADCNGDSILNILDFVCYQSLFQAGCP